MVLQFEPLVPLPPLLVRSPFDVVQFHLHHSTRALHTRSLRCCRSQIQIHKPKEGRLCCKSKGGEGEAKINAIVYFESDTGSTLVAPVTREI